MWKSLLNRILGMIIVLIGISILAFALVRVGNVDPAVLIAGDNATEEQVAVMREKMGLDQPYIIQYVNYINDLLHGDLGWSWKYSRSVSSLIADRLPKTARLAAFAVLISIGISIPLGLIAGIKKGSIFDVFAMFFAILGQSLSPVWVGCVVILVFGAILKWFPTQGFGGLRHMVLPGITLGLESAAMTTRLMRSGMIDVLEEDYITATRARGISKTKVNLKYAFKNAAIPIITNIGGNIGYMLAGSLVVENLFSWPGMGQLMIQSINMRDYAVVQSLLLLSALIFSICNLIADLIYTMVDPRITFS